MSHYTEINDAEKAAPVTAQDDPHSKNKEFRRQMYEHNIIDMMGDIRQLYNHSNFPTMNFRRKIYGLTLEYVVAFGTVGSSYWYERPFPESIYKRIVSALKKQSFVKKIKVDLRDKFGRWEGERSHTVGYVVDKKKFRRWFQQNQHRFLQKPTV
ncbi:hypothetical protein [Flavobacterium sp.]|jgi:hypothetical protein|uniref:hypothetical protein n=1 Tax=Flavobacterium sp. TaxID=239 RepID=UPI0037BEB03D